MSQKCHKKSQPHSHKRSFHHPTTTKQYAKQRIIHSTTTY